MGMTMTQKILAKHAGLESVRAGQLALAPLLNLHSRAVLLHEGLELFGQSGDLLFGQSAVHDENDLIVCGNLSHSWLHLLLD